MDVQCIQLEQTKNLCMLLWGVRWWHRCWHSRFWHSMDWLTAFWNKDFHGGCSTALVRADHCLTFLKSILGVNGIGACTGAGTAWNVAPMTPRLELGIGFLGLSNNALVLVLMTKCLKVVWHV